MAACACPTCVPRTSITEERALYDDIVGGPRGTGPQHFPLTTPDGALTGPFGVMVHEPALGRPLQELGSAVRSRPGSPTGSARSRSSPSPRPPRAPSSSTPTSGGRAVGLTDGELVASSAGRHDRTTASSGRRPTCADACWPGTGLTVEKYAGLAGCSARRRSPS